ncbi:mother-specific HO expression [Rhizina undulata]
MNGTAIAAPPPADDDDTAAAAAAAAAAATEYLKPPTLLGPSGSGRESPILENDHHHHDLDGHQFSSPASLPHDFYDSNSAPSSTYDGHNHYSRVTAGKSGRVIEKLMAENDRLRRELKVETTAREEERKAKEAIRSARDTLQSTNENLILQTNIDKSSLAKKDRKIEELKAEREAEKNRRLEMDMTLKSLTSRSDEEMQQLKNTLSLEAADKKRAVNQYEVLQQSWKHLDENYRTRVHKLQGQLDALQTERDKDTELLKRLEVTIEQQRQEVDKMRMAKMKLTERYEAMLNEASSDMEQMKSLAASTEKLATQTLEDAKATLGELRHLVGVKKSIRGPESEEAEEK